jgi:nitroreductase
LSSGKDAQVTQANHRSAGYPIDEMFLTRWSPRAFNGQPISEHNLLTMIEAGRWAASSYNSQPWRFLWARRDTPHWNKFLDLLVPFNQSWAKDASALVILVSNTLMRAAGSDVDVPSPSHSFDAGAASGYFTLQASRMGWYAHGMVGFDMNRAINELKVPTGFRVEAAYAVGQLGDKNKLPEKLQAREQPSTRIPLKELAFEGAFPSVSG